MSTPVKLLGSMAAALAAVVALLLLAQSNPSAAAPLRLAQDGHFVSPVTINGQGPFYFVVDTGAQRSVLAPELADRLKLTELGSAHIHATSGVSAAGLAILENYSSPLFSRTAAMVAVLPAGGMVKDGVMGMDLFTSRRLELNFAQRSVDTAQSGPPPADFTAVPITIVQGSFIVTTVTVNGVQARAMIDTGARRTIGNSLLRKALGLVDSDPRLSPAEPVGGATADKTGAVKAQIGSITLGAQYFDKPLVTFADVPVLETLGLSDGPAMILGLDLLQRLKAVAVDYPRSELQMKP